MEVKSPKSSREKKKKVYDNEEEEEEEEEFEVEPPAKKPRTPTSGDFSSLFTHFFKSLLHLKVFLQGRGSPLQLKLT